jgi:transposase-like protein
MSNKRYTEEFKIKAARQIVERGHPVAEVSSRLRISQQSLYQWIKKRPLRASRLDRRYCTRVPDFRSTAAIGSAAWRMAGNDRRSHTAVRS